jgi:hypothetical protein
LLLSRGRGVDTRMAPHRNLNLRYQ